MRCLPGVCSQCLFHLCACVCGCVCACLQSTADPMDPVLNSLRAAGSLKAPQMCNTQGLDVSTDTTPPPPALFDARGPLTLVADTEALITAIRQAVELNRVNGSVYVSACTSGTLLHASKQAYLDGLLDEKWSCAVIWEAFA